MTPADSAGTTTNLTTGCHIGFASQPGDTQIGATITDQGASNGGAIKVGLFDQSNHAISCPLANSVGCGNITITKNETDGTLGGTTNVAMSNAGQASFSNLAISSVASGTCPNSFSFSATADSGIATNTATSGSFNLVLYAQHCTSGCSFTQKLLPGAINSFADLTGGTSFDFMTLSPYSLSSRATLPAGCQHRLDLGVTVFAETDGRNANGTLTLTFDVNMNNIKAKYGNNVGQQFIPMCAGGKPVDPITHKAIDGTTVDGVGGSAHGWTGDRLTLLEIRRQSDEGGL